MTELDLYKFISENSIEWNRQDNDGKPDVLIFPYVFQLEDFCELTKNYHADEGLEMRLKGTYVAIWMADLCDYFGIDMDKVFIDQSK